MTPNSGKVNNTFPEFLVGVWEAKVTKQIKWGIKLEPDGSISKIWHVWAGPINVRDGGKESEGPDEGTYYVHILGPCEANFDPNSRNLSAKIILEHWIMKLPNGTLEGNDEDYFTGPVSVDGQTWTAKWRSYCHLKGATPPDRDLIDANPVTLIFHRKRFD